MIKKIIHLSDLHFNTERPLVVEQLILDIKLQNPDMIIVSGDLTQRAYLKQFKAAKLFLNKLEGYKILCVPGNHDISLYNVFERFFFPFYKYNCFIKPNFLDYYISDNIIILGVCSVTPWRAMGGQINQKELDRIYQFFSQHPSTITKIIVMHHNLIRSQRHHNMIDAEKIINFFASLNVNIILSGHIHSACLEQLKRSYLSHNMYVITAGTAISSRTIEKNSYNLITFSNMLFNVEVRAFESERFISVRNQAFQL